MSKEKVELQLKFTPNYKKYSILLNCYRVGGMKWNDVDGAIFHKIDLSKEDVLFALGVNQQIADLEAKLAESEDFTQGYRKECAKIQSENVQLKQQLKDTDKLMQEYLSKCLSLEQQLAEKEKEIEYQESMKILSIKNQNQTAIEVLEEMLDNEVYINSKLDFEDGNYVLSKIIRTKIEELNNGK